MPILTEAAPPSKRRPWLWGLLGVPLVAFLLFAAVVWWGWERPVLIRHKLSVIAFGRARGTTIPGGSLRFGRSGNLFVKIPGGQNSGWYGVVWGIHW